MPTFSKLLGEMKMISLTNKCAPDHELILNQFPPDHRPEQKGDAGLVPELQSSPEEISAGRKRKPAKQLRCWRFR
jgi:hypothetical protein